MTTEFIGIDFETFCKVDLRKYGFDRYINDESFRALIVSLDEDGILPVTYDFVFDGASGVDLFMNYINQIHSDGRILTAQNVGFERGVMTQLGVSKKILRTMLDSAVVSRIQGASSHLEAAAPQLTAVKKLDVGSKLIQRFSVPNKWNGGEAPTEELIRKERDDYKDWMDFIRYCEVDAHASRAIVERYAKDEDTWREQRYELLTADMNDAGWRVDLKLVREMQIRAEVNRDEALAKFATHIDPNLNLNSVPQLKKWCTERGVKTTSFDQDHVEQLIGRLERGLAKIPLASPKRAGYEEVLEMLRTKQVIGGSSLSKLQKIQDLVGPGNRLRGQYMHAGAGQTYRTSAKGVQMQNLKRLGPDPMDMDLVYDLSVPMTNDTLAENLRQVFTATDENGFLLVGDFSSVESRGLAWLAGEDWKIDAYRKGQDIYKVLASKFQGIGYDEVTKEARAEGKYSELSCGYQAGGGAVKAFMHKLGFEVSEEGAAERVAQWRDANPKIVELWATLDELLHETLSLRRRSTRLLAHGLVVSLEPIDTPESLRAQHAGALSVRMDLASISGKRILSRVFHGLYLRGKNICYYKPSERKSGDLWNASYMDPKTKLTKFYSIYGGKLAGILTQSLCREIFFHSLKLMSDQLGLHHNATIVGQFHDEIVVDWKPFTPGAGGNYGAITLEQTKEIMESTMSTVIPELKGFPLTADIKQDYRYTK